MNDLELNKIQFAKGVVDIFIRMRYEWGAYEFTKESMDKLKKNLDIVDDAIKTGIVPDSMLSSFIRTLEYGKDVLNSPSYLEMHKL